MIDSNYRILTVRERGLIERLLEPEFQGRDELRLQLKDVTAKQIHEDGTLYLQCSGGPPAPTKYRKAMEASATDSDGVGIAISLFVDEEGFMNMLEVIKYGPIAIIKPPTAADLTL